MGEAEEFSLVCQSMVYINPGDDVVLSCQLIPAINATFMEIKWWHCTNMVCQWKYGQVKVEKEYAGRVHFPVNLEKGNLSLKIRDVRKSQSGQYTCEVLHEHQVKMKHIYLDVKSVDFRLVVPEHTIYADQGADVKLQVIFSPKTSAKSLTVNWLKEKVFIYEYVHGKEIRNVHYKDRVGLNIQELSSGNIILTLKHVQQSDSGSYTCQVNYEEYTGEKKIELHVIVSRMINGMLCKYMERRTTIGELTKNIKERRKFIKREEIISQKEKENALQSIKLLRKHQNLLELTEVPINESHPWSYRYPLKINQDSLELLEQSLLQLSLQQSDQLSLLQSLQHLLQSLQSSRQQLVQLSLLQSLQDTLQLLQQSLQSSPQQSLSLHQLLQLLRLQFLLHPLQQPLKQPFLEERLQSLQHPLQQLLLEQHLQSLQQSLQQPLLERGLQSLQQILPKQLLFISDNGDDMDEDRNKNTLILFDPRPTGMEIIFSIMHDVAINTPVGQEVEEDGREVEEETEQRVHDVDINTPVGQEVEEDGREVEEETEQRVHDVDINTPVGQEVEEDGRQVEEETEQRVHDVDINTPVGQEVEEDGQEVEEETEQRVHDVDINTPVGQEVEEDGREVEEETEQRVHNEEKNKPVGQETEEEGQEVEEETEQRVEEAGRTEITRQSREKSTASKQDIPSTVLKLDEKCFPDICFPCVVC